MIVQQRGAPFQRKGNSVAQAEIKSQSESSAQEAFAILPEVFQVVCPGVEGVGLVVLKTVGIGSPSKEIGIYHPVGIKSCEQRCQVQYQVQVSLYEFEIVHLGGGYPASFSLPSRGAEAHPERGAEVVP
ncbi:hypothetical protein SDC9_123038 [bioreactor metagenome]|uniref:Uncharacterized protein n=1 Tax=bioreactor metagenome TaxID=1076179 RepID=A0A645CGK7_9ZZZZ